MSMAKSIHYINRKGKTYYLHAATTKTGKTRYVMTKTEDGALTEIPKGYSITESVNGQVSIGRIRPKRITDLEEARVKSELNKCGLNKYRCGIQGLCITVYEPLYDESEYLDTYEPMGVTTTAMTQYVSERIEKGPFNPVMRFHVLDQDERIFEVERMTYRGDGGWSWSLNCGPLAKLTQKYIKHLGRESFFDLR